MKRSFLRLFLLLSGFALAAGAQAQTPASLVECQVRGGLPNFFEKLNAGGEVHIGYLGGSITAQDGWRPKTLQWFQKKFPQARLSEINAAIGGTGSDLGVFRLKHDVLGGKPDLLLVEFAVNDGGAAPEQIHRCMEGIVRQTWRDNPATDVCFVYTLAGNMLQTLQEGKLPRSAAVMEQLADFYAIPSINMALEVARLEKAGQLIFKGDKPKTDADKAALGSKILFSPDAVHPYTDTGHQLYLEAVARGMELMRPIGKPGPHPLARPFVADNLEQAKLVPFSRAQLSPGWQKLPATNHLVKSFGNRLPELWQGAQPGQTATFSFRGTMVGLYDLLGPDCGQLIITLDDKAPVVRPRFDSYCTYHRLAMLHIGAGLSDTRHTVKLEIHPDQPDKAQILSKLNNKMDDPKRFDGTAVYVGAIMLVGELVE